MEAADAADDVVYCHVVTICPSITTNNFEYCRRTTFEIFIELSTLVTSAEIASNNAL
jgi:hypothetical protein